MRNIVLLLLTALLFSFVTGCAVVEETEAIACERPDKIFEDIWVIHEKNTQIEVTPEEAILKAYSLIKYRGENSVQDVSIIIKSPLTSNFVGDDLVQYYGTVNPGDDIVYTLDYLCSDFRKKIPAGSDDKNLIEDFLHNSYLDISWKDNGEYHHMQFYNWDDDCQLGL